MTKKIALLIILLSFGFELNADWIRPVDKEANEDKYGFNHDFCPKTNYGHTAIIVDTTEKFNENQYALLQNQILIVQYGMMQSLSHQLVNNETR